MRLASLSSRGSNGRGLVDLPRAGEPLRAEDEAMRTAEQWSEQTGNRACRYWSMPRWAGRLEGMVVGDGVQTLASRTKDKHACSLERHF